MCSLWLFLILARSLSINALQNMSTLSSHMFAMLGLSCISFWYFHSESKHTYKILELRHSFYKTFFSSSSFCSTTTTAVQLTCKHYKTFQSRQVVRFERLAAGQVGCTVFPARDLRVGHTVKRHWSRHFETDKQTWKLKHFVVKPSGFFFEIWHHFYTAITHTTKGLFW